MPKKATSKSAQEVVSSITKVHGSGSAMLMSKSDDIPCEVITSGCLAFDLATGKGGFPRARITELYGAEGAGKTTIALQLVAEAQAGGELCGYIDMEHSLDMEYAQKLGVRRDLLIMSQPDTGEQALDIMERMVRSGSVGVVVLDSVAALVPQAEVSGNYGDSHMGLQARLMSQAMRKLNGPIEHSNVVAVFINQLRSNMSGYGNPDVTSGGRGLKFYASIRAEIKRVAAIKEGDRVVGNRNKITIVKNKVASPYVVREYDLIFGRGTDPSREVLDCGEEYGLLTRSGSHYSIASDDIAEPGVRLGGSRASAATFLDENIELRNSIRGKILEKGLPKSKGAA